MNTSSSSSCPSSIVSLYVTGIDPATTNEAYIYKFFTKLGKVHKINYRGKNIAHVHMRYLHDTTNIKIKKISDEISSGKTISMVHNVFHYWNILLYQPNMKLKHKPITMQDLYTFAKQYKNTIMNATSAAPT